MNRLLRCTARLTSVAAAGSILLFWGHHLPKMAAPPRILSQLRLLMLAVAGLLLGRRREHLGGLIGIIGIGGFLVLEGLGVHPFSLFAPLFLMLLPGLLCLTVGPAHAAPLESEA
jgi:hypothetical protein